jgi:two-component system, cell cycle response regulator DivK
MTAPLRPTIMIVDDFEDARDIYREYLTFKGYEVVLASNGFEAVQLARNDRPSIIFMDLRMPGMTGAEALQELRSDEQLRGVPIIAFTAHALEAERVGALLDGFDEVIAKPCLPDELLAAIERLLSPPSVSASN